MSRRRIDLRISGLNEQSLRRLRTPAMAGFGPAILTAVILVAIPPIPDPGISALGFAQVHPLIDTLFTGLLLVGGAERTEALLKAMGAAPGGEAGKDSKPIEIKGRVVLEDSHAPEQPAAEVRSIRA